MRACVTMRFEHMRALGSGFAKFGRALFLLSLLSPSYLQAAEGVALAIVYDTSGSMRELVRDGKGGRSPKFVIGNRALEAVVSKIEHFATNSTGRNVQAGLFTFSGNGA